MAASYEGAKAAIKDRLIENWTTTPIRCENDADPDNWPPKDGDGYLLPWVFLEIRSLGSVIYGQGVPGNQLWRYTGQIWVHVFVPTGTGDSLAGTYADQIGEIFRNATFYSDVTPGSYVRSGLDAGDAPHHGSGDIGDDNGTTYRVSEIIGFDYFHRG